MGEIDRLLDQLDRTWSGEAWHGPALREALETLGPDRAARRPIPGAHTAWELALHLATWQDAVIRRLGGERYAPDAADDFPSPPPPTPEAWQDAIAALERTRGRLRAAVAALAPEELDRPTPATAPWSPYGLIHGVIQHDLYHAGQIALLARAAGEAAR